MVSSGSSDKSHDASQSNEGDKTTFLSDTGGGLCVSDLVLFCFLVIIVEAFLSVDTMWFQETITKPRRDKQ